MAEMLEYMRESFYRLAGKIVGLLTGSDGYEVEAVKARVLDIRTVASARIARRPPPYGSCQGRH